MEDLRQLCSTFGGMVASFKTLFDKRIVKTLTQKD